MNTNKGQIANNSLDTTITTTRTDLRLQQLEGKVFKQSKRLKATDAQRFLMFYYLGFITPIIELQILQKHKDVLVSVLLNIDPDNTRKYISELGKKIKPLLETQSNYNFLNDFFEEVGYTSIASEVDKIRLRILSTKK